MFASAQGIEELEIEGRFDIATAHPERPRPTAGRFSSTEAAPLHAEAAKQIIEVTEGEGPFESRTVGVPEAFREHVPLGASTLEIESAFERDLAELVEGRAAIGILEDLVGDGDLLEALLHRGIPRIEVGVRLAGELAIPLLDRFEVGVAIDVEHAIGIHRDSLLAFPRASSRTARRQASRA